MPVSQCKNCDSILQGPVCHQCGQVQFVKRWNTWHLIRQVFEQITNIEKGFTHTAIKLFKSPGILINDYWTGKTVPYYNPFRYAFIWIALTLLINFWLGIDDIMQDQLQSAVISENQVSVEEIQAADVQFDAWFNVLVLLLIPFNALMTLWLFKFHRFNFAEHLILNAFALGQQSLIGIVTQLVFYLIPSLFIIYLPFNFVVGLIYNSYLFRQVFRESWFKIVGKAFILGVLGLIVFFVLVSLLTRLALLL